MKSLNELIGHYPNNTDALTETVIVVVIAVFAVVLLVTVLKMRRQNKKSLYWSNWDADRFSQWSVYGVSLLVAIFMSFNIGSVFFFANKASDGKEYYNQVVQATTADIESNFAVQDVQLHDHVFRGEYYGIETILKTAEDTYHVSFIYDKETDSMVPKPTSDTLIEELPVTPGSTMESIVEDYDTFAGAYLQKVYDIEDNGGRETPVLGDGRFITSIILSSVGVLAFAFIVFNKSASNYVVTGLGAIGIGLSFVILTPMAISFGDSSHLKDARIQNIEHNYDIVHGDYETRDGRGMKGDILFTGATETESVRFEYIEPLGHMVAEDDEEAVQLKQGSSLSLLIED